MTVPTWLFGWRFGLLMSIPLLLLFTALIAIRDDEPVVVPNIAPCPISDVPVLPTGCPMPPAHWAHYWVLPSGQSYCTEGDYPQPTELPNATERTP